MCQQRIFILICIFKGNLLAINTAIELYPLHYKCFRQTMYIKNSEKYGIGSINKTKIIANFIILLCFLIINNTNGACRKCRSSVFAVESKIFLGMLIFCLIL